VLQDVLKPGAAPLRIAFVSGGLPLGGSTTFLLNISAELVRRGHKALILGMEHANPLAPDFIAQSLTVICQDERTAIYEERILATLRELSAFRPHVLVANLSAISFELLRYAPPGVLRAGVAHTDDPGVYRMLPDYAGCIDVMVAVSETIRTKLGKIDAFRNIPVVYAPLGVPMPDGSATQKKDPGQPLRIIYTGRIEREQKRAHLFPGILDALKKSGIPFHWTIAGDGPLLPLLREKMAATSPTQAVSFTGRVDYRAIPALLRQHDIFFLASDYEGLPLSLLEAMAHGLVPVISDLPSGVRDVVDAGNGRLVPPGDLDGYAREILWLHDHRTEMAAMSLAARQKVGAHFTVGAMTDRWLAIFQKAQDAAPQWPLAGKILPPVGSGASFAFSPPGRWLRRLSGNA